PRPACRPSARPRQTRTGSPQRTACDRVVGSARGGAAGRLASMERASRAAPGMSQLDGSGRRDGPSPAPRPDQKGEPELAARVLDVGCGIAAPALRIARLYGCRVTGVNISREQVRQGRELIAARGLSERVFVQRGDARALEFPDGSFDAIVCLEAAGDICVTEA